MPEDVGVLTYILNVIREVLLGGIARTDDYSLWLLRQFAIIETIIFGILWALKKSDLAEAIFKKLMLFSFFLWVITNWMPFLTTLSNTMTRWGFEIGNPSFDTNLFLDPSKIAAMGLEVTNPLWVYLGELSWRKLLHGITVGWAGIFIILSYFLMSIQVFLTLVEFWIVGAACLILLPFSVLSPTAWIGEGAFRAVLGMCLKLLVLSMLISLGYDVISGVVIEDPPNFRSTMGALIASLTMAFLVWQAPNMVGGMIAGKPSLRAGSAVSSMVGASYLFSRTYSNIRNSNRPNIHHPRSPDSNPAGGNNGGGRNTYNGPRSNMYNPPLNNQKLLAPPDGARQRYSNRNYRNS